MLGFQLGSCARHMGVTYALALVVGGETKSECLKSPQQSLTGTRKSLPLWSHLSTHSLSTLPLCSELLRFPREGAGMGQEGQEGTEVPTRSSAHTQVIEDWQEMRW